MSPAKFHDDEHATRREINGPRPSPLRVNKESHFIHKSSSLSSSSNSNSNSSSSSTLYGVAKQQHAAAATHQQRHPVIIYTHSPKIIHTQARDFMALVQKLTGLSRSDGETAAPPQPQQGVKTSSDEGNDNVKPPAVSHDDNESSSVLTDEVNCGDVKVISSSSVSPMFNPPNPCFADIPLFTPNSSNFFCSPRPLYRYPDSVFASPNMGNSLSPSVLEFMKGLPEY
ncbi:hypothetical protein L1049_005583 [Liquidambar formosana]|uniref:VQ domain-containing protein n=1 Tax=Liquidambar formosana TaxID=63359 RepID=A0AAP0WPT8_LIQFO